MRVDPIIGLAVLAGIVITVALIPPSLRLWSRIHTCRANVPDLHHNKRQPVPRCGGLVLIAVFLIAATFLLLLDPLTPSSAQMRLPVILGALAMFSLGMIDDLWRLGARKKLLGQVVIATVIALAGIQIQSLRLPYFDLWIPLGGWGILVTVVWVVAFTNLINLIDGADGLAGGICLMMMVLLVFSGAQSSEVTLLAAAMVGALLGFLRYNWPPARIYLGDGGAYFLGSLIGMLTIVSSQKGTVFAALIAPLFVLALPILDTTMTILRRGLLGLPLFRPDRRHLHHRLMRLGLSRKQIVIGLHSVTLLFLLLAFASFAYQGRLTPILAGVGFLVLLVLARQFDFSREWLSPGRTFSRSIETRQEVQYALALARLLELEAARAHSMADLWQDFSFMVRKLGFSFARFQLDHTERRWRLHHPGTPATPPHQLRQELEGGRAGILELRAPVHLMDERLFELLADLTTEAWLTAFSRLSTVSNVVPQKDLDVTPAVRPHARFYIPAWMEPVTAGEWPARHGELGRPRDTTGAPVI
jgi:UDP-GlcNAc:undecaprenyl-phosphate/decaprenyl-phosphate GlcNAc-1-phosphate transferase